MNLLDLVNSSAVSQRLRLSFVLFLKCCILCTPPHNGEKKKTALLKMSGIKIHSNVHCFCFS